MSTSGLSSPEIIAAIKETAVLPENLASWPDWTVAKLFALVTQRHQSLVSTENVKVNSGYSNQEEFVTCTIGTDLYPLPDRSCGNTLRMLEYQVPGSLVWKKLDRIDVTDTRYYDRGPTSTNVPQWYAVKDGWVELYPSPNAAYTLKMTFFIRPSALVTGQSDATVADGSSGVIRGLITSTANLVSARQVTVNVLPKDMLASGTPDIATNTVCDVIHAAGNYNLPVYSVPVTVSGTTITFQGTKDLTKVRQGDWLRVAEQSDWPTNLPPEFHRMIADRAAMEVLMKSGNPQDAATVGQSVQADIERYRIVIRPQVKNQPVTIPIVPMFARGGGNWFRGGWPQ